MNDLSAKQKRDPLRYFKFPLGMLALLGALLMCLILRVGFSDTIDYSVWCEPVVYYPLLLLSYHALTRTLLMCLVVALSLILLAFARSRRVNWTFILIGLILGSGLLGSALQDAPITSTMLGDVEFRDGVMYQLLYVRGERVETDKTYPIHDFVLFKCESVSCSIEASYHLTYEEFENVSDSDIARAKLYWASKDQWPDMKIGDKIYDFTAWCRWFGMF